MIAWAIGIGATSVYVGLLLSYHYNTSGGATIVFVTVCAFFAVLTAQVLVHAIRRRVRPSAVRAAPTTDLVGAS